MADNPKILVLLKPSDQQPALARVAQYARMVPAIEVVACRVINEFTSADKEQITARVKGEFETLKHEYPSIKNFSLKLLFNRNVAEAFCEEERQGDYDLGVISANRRNTIKDLFISTIDSSIMRSTDVPLLVVKNVNTAQTLGKPILIAIDFSEAEHLHKLDEYLMKSAVKFAENYNGEIHIVNCVSPLNRGLMSGETSGSKLLGSSSLDRAGIHYKVTLEFAEKFGIGDDCVHVVEGRIDEEIPRLCEQLNARMVCMGTTPRSSFFGSIDSIASELVLEQIRGDVYIVSSAHIEKLEGKEEQSRD
ncbi:MAG: universal stress protein [Succinivibrio sp.]|nr:universal stress protein [Succinivibrio sp.]